MRKPNFSRELFILACIGFWSLPTQGQKKPSEYAAQYQGEYSVGLQEHTTTTIELKKGELEITEEVQRSRLFLDKRSSANAKVSLEYELPFTEIEDVSAYTLVPQSAKDDYSRERVRDISDQKLMSEDVFHDGTRAKVFHFPMVQKGAITVMNYTRKIHDPRLVGSEVFQYYQRMEKQDFILQYDSDVAVDIRYFNCDESDFHYEQEERGGKIIHHWVPRKLEKLKDEDQMPSPLAVVPHIVYRIRSYEYRGETVPVLRDLNDLHQGYSEYIKDVRYDSSQEIADLADSLTQGLSDPSEKTARIFRWMQDNVKYVAFEEGVGGFVPRAPSQVFTRRFGDCKDKSCLLIALLKEAEVPAYHSWIGTRELPYSYYEVPSSMSDNHMIATVELNGELLFLDATSENLPFPLPSSFIQGKEALIGLSPDSFLIAEVPVVPAAQNLNSDSLYLQLDGSRIKGRGRRDYYGYYADLLNAVDNRNDAKTVEDRLKAHVWKGNNKCHSHHLELERGQMLSSIHYQMEIPDYAYQSGEAIFINLNLEKAMADAELEKDRIHPLEFDHTFALERHFTLAIPEGYSLDYLPKGMEYHRGQLKASINYQQEAGVIHYYLNIIVDQLQIPPAQFDDFNQMIKSLNRQYQESLTLRKI